MEQKQHSLQKVGLGTVALFISYWIYSLFVQQNLSLPIFGKTLIGLVLLFGVGTLFFLVITSKIPKTPAKKGKVSFKILVNCFLLQFTALLLMVIISVIVSQLINIPEPGLELLVPEMLFLVLIFNPLAEEFVFRRLFADRLLAHGERFFILSSAFCFALAHGVSLGIPQIFYTFVLGLIWAYLFVKTGSLVLPVVFHAISNLFGGVFMQILQQVSAEAMGIYSALLMILGVIGLILFLANRKNIVLDGQQNPSFKGVIKEVFANKGILIYALITIVFIVIKATLA